MRPSPAWGVSGFSFLVLRTTRSTEIRGVPPLDVRDSTLSRGAADRIVESFQVVAVRVEGERGR